MKTVKPGIRLKPNGKYVATKSIDGQRYYKEAATLREAESWKNKFHPLVNKTPSPSQLVVSPTPSSANEFSNGRDKFITVKEVFEKYLDGPLKSLGDYTQYKLPLRMKRFLTPIFAVRMAALNPEVITALLENAKLGASKTYGRSSFNEELKYLSSILNWYKGEHDFTFNLPITKYHKRIGTISQKDDGRKHLKVDELVAFIDALPWPLSFLATIEFLYGLRINETCALTTDTVKLKAREVHIKHSISWVKDVPAFKTSTKTKDYAIFKMTEEVYDGFTRLHQELPYGCKFYFHHNGGLPRYRTICDTFNETLRKIGVTDVSGTHFLRHTAAMISRKFGGIDASQAILRHASSRMSEHYAKLDVKEKSTEVIIHAEKLFLEARRATNATKSQDAQQIQ